MTTDSPPLGRADAIAATALGTVLLALALLPGVAGAQEGEGFPGVELGLLYETSYQPALAVKPFGGRFGGQAAAGRVEAIVARDLRYSDRFQLLDSLPASLTDAAGVDYQLWDQLGAVWLLTGQVEGAGEGYVLVLEVHDVVYGEVKERGRFPLPEPSAEGFRMAVHRASDTVVRWITGEPGMAASRIVFSRPVQDAEGQRIQELYIVDSDGEGLRRLTNYRSITMSPTWSPDGTRLAYSSYKSGSPRIYELDLETGQERIVEPNRPGQHITPAYHPDGGVLAFTVLGGDRSGIFTYDLQRDCCLAHLSGGSWNDLSPTYSPDGSRIAFNSNRLGTRVPQIYVMPAEGGEADLISPYVYGDAGYYTSPDWSPRGDEVVFHGRIRRGRYQILVAEVQDRGHRLIQLTSEGNNEDPSWAPDGRHIVFSGERSYGFGLFVVDAVTGRIRSLVQGIRVNVPEWSPALRPPSPRSSDGGP